MRHSHRMLAKSINRLKKQSRQIDGRKVQKWLFDYIPDATPGSKSFRNPRLPVTAEYTEVSCCSVLVPSFGWVFFSMSETKCCFLGLTERSWPALRRAFAAHRHYEAFMSVCTNAHYYDWLKYIFFSFIFESILALKKIQAVLYF